MNVPLPREIMERRVTRGDLGQETSNHSSKHSAWSISWGFVDRFRVLKRSSSPGFSVIELLVSVGIFIFITTLVLVKHSQFSGNILLGNLAYDVALSIRQAQVYGLSVREFEAGTGQFVNGYGIHFAAGSPTTYFLFADLPPGEDKKYSGSEEIAEVFTLYQGNVVARFCGVLPGGVERCSDGDPSITSLDIFFSRGGFPALPAIIKSDLPAESYGQAKIVVRSRSGSERSVLVASTGQISVEQQSGPPK